MLRLALAAVTSIALLAGCGGDDDADEGVVPGSTAAPNVTPAAPPAGTPDGTADGTEDGTPAAATSDKAKVCGDAMTAALSRAYRESKDLPAEDRDLAFAAAAGELPVQCKGLTSEVLLGLLEVAKEKALPDPK